MFYEDLMANMRGKAVDGVDGRPRNTIHTIVILDDHFGDKTARESKDLNTKLPSLGGAMGAMTSWISGPESGTYRAK
jgi:hypothetical protein